MEGSYFLKRDILDIPDRQDVNCDNLHSYSPLGEGYTTEAPDLPQY